MREWRSQTSHAVPRMRNDIWRSKATKDLDCLSEKRIKRILRDFLTSEGWNPEIAFDSRDLVDVEARRGSEQWIIEVKGLESLEPLHPAIVNSFVSVLGEILQRMNDSKCKYSVALPDIEPFRRLWERVPALAKDRTGITALFVRPTGEVIEVTETVSSSRWQ